MHPRCQLLSGHLATWRLVARSSTTGRSLATAAATPTTAPAVTTEAPTTSTSTPTPAVKNPLQRRKGGDLGAHLPKHVLATDAHIPDYPYGDHALFKQANRGLYGEQMIQFGNNVSHKTKTKTRRDWKPNVLTKSLYSVALKKRVKLRITSKVLKTMDREGGLDEYLLKDSIHRIKELGPMGWALRWTLMQRPEVIDRLRADATALGLDQATIDKQWPTPRMVSQQQAADAFLARQAQLAALDPEAANEAVEPQMWAPAGKDAAAANAIESQEKKAAKMAAVEYERCLGAAERYLSRGVVDSIEEGLKLAFVRAPERWAARTQLKKDFRAKLDAQFKPKDLQAIRERFNLPHIKDRTARKIAYNQWRRAEIDKTEGGYEAWRAAQTAAATAAQQAKVDQAGGFEAFIAARKATYAAQLAKAETASTNEALEPKERRLLEKAIAKADLAMRARLSGGKDEYVQLVLEDMRARRPAGELAALARKAQKSDKDAWGALVSESQKMEQVRA
jgi:large subunit ribosomal protein L28